MKYAKIVASDAVAAGVLGAAEIEDARRQLPEQVFRELFLAEPSDDGGNPFGINAIAACMVTGLSNAVPAGFGIDLAKSTDWTANVGLDHAGRVCTFDRFQLPWQETIVRIHETVGKHRALVDSTGVGDPVLEALQRDGHGTQFEGYKFTSESKQKLMEGLSVAIQGRKIFFPDGIIRMELEAYEYEYTRTGVRYGCPSGVHDDCVCALALAWRLCSIGANIVPQVARGGVAQGPRMRPGGAGYYDRSRY
jgi:hypothetical protein